MSATYPLDLAVCDGVATADYDPFFADSAEAELKADALAMCSICPAQEACLAYAVETRQTFGIWGGKTQRASGHPYDAVNTYYAANGERRCRACRARIARARRRARRTSGGER